MPSSLNPVERETIALFVRLATLLNLPRSVGELYGLLYLSGEPLCLNDCMERLGMSRGSVCQGLRILRSFGAARIVYIPGNRRDYYVAERELRRMTGGFIAEKLQPQLAAAGDQLTRIEKLLDQDPSGKKLRPRIRQLKKWRTRANRLLPLVTRIVSRR